MPRQAMPGGHEHPARLIKHDGRRMHELALFAGAGGGVLGAELLDWRTVCYVEWERAAAEKLKQRMQDKLLEKAPIWNDVQTFDGKPWRGLVDIVSGGFPCQPFSTAGKRLGADDPRNMWPATLRVIRMVAPRWCLLENVPGLIQPYLGQILGDLAGAGYDAWWGVLSAASVGAPHLRKRLWIVAHANGVSRQTTSSK